MPPECPVCFDYYNNDIERQPMSLVCGHSLCHACVARMPTKVCPTCRMMYDVAVPNFALQEMLAEPSTWNIIRCDSCSLKNLFVPNANDNIPSAAAVLAMMAVVGLSLLYICRPAKMNPLGQQAQAAAQRAAMHGQATQHREIYGHIQALNFGDSMAMRFPMQWWPNY